MLVMISRTFVPICNRFRTKQANSGKIRTFRVGTGYPYLTPSLRGTPSPISTKFCHNELESLRQPTVKIS